MDEFTIKFDIVKQEMEAVQNGIHRYGEVQFTVKGWAITIFSGFILFSVQEAQPVFISLAAMAVFLFWVLDAIFKSIQNVYIKRAQEIETFLQDIADNNAFKATVFKTPDTEEAFRELQGSTSAWFMGVLRAGKGFQLALLYLAMLLILGIISITNN